jgi:hypothetical protein
LFSYKFLAAKSISSGLFRASFEALILLIKVGKLILLFLLAELVENDFIFVKSIILIYKNESEQNQHFVISLLMIVFINLLKAFKFLKFITQLSEFAIQQGAFLISLFHLLAQPVFALIFY